MAEIVSVNEVHNGRGASISFHSGQGIKTTYERTFQVITDDTETDLRNLIHLDELPNIGDSYPTDEGCAARSITPNTTENEYVYLVTVVYENPTREGFSSDPVENDWLFSTATTPLEQVAELDYGGHSQSAGQRNITNSAGEPFDPPLTEPIFLRTYTLTKFFSTWDENEAIERIGRLNSEEITLLGVKIPKHCLRCEQWDTTGKQFFDGGEFYKLTAKFITKQPYVVQSNGEDLEVAGFVRAVVDQGFNEKQGTSLIAITGTSNTLAKEPQLLNGMGARLQDDSYDPHYRLFRTTLEADMTEWGLPTAT